MTVIDPTETDTDDAKYMIHSVTPNFTKHWDRDTEQACLKAVRPIQPGRLMAWDYGAKAVKGQPWAEYTTVCKMSNVCTSIV